MARVKLQDSVDQRKRQREETLTVHQAIKKMIDGQLSAKDKHREDLAPLIDKKVGTINRRFEDCGEFTINELIAICSGLYIPVEEFRSTINY